MEIRKLNVMFAKAGSGSTTTRITLPKTWVDSMGIVPDDRLIFAEFDGEKIILRPSEAQLDRLMKIDGNMIEYVRSYDDNWAFIWHSNEERKERTYFSTGNSENPPIDEFLKDYPTAKGCEFVEV
jgi:bifunctional DNA-binding transcriptional regulator/antitoxin component of YhaV-PrlF toxin-antitoxin module